MWNQVNWKFSRASREISNLCVWRKSEFQFPMPLWTCPTRLSSTPVRHSCCDVGVRVGLGVGEFVSQRTQILIYKIIHSSQYWLYSYPGWSTNCGTAFMAVSNRLAEWEWFGVHRSKQSAHRRSNSIWKHPPHHTPTRWLHVLSCSALQISRGEYETYFPISMEISYCVLHDKTPLKASLADRGMPFFSLFMKEALPFQLLYEDTFSRNLLNRKCNSIFSRIWDTIRKRSAIPFPWDSALRSGPLWFQKIEYTVSEFLDERCR